MQSNSQPRTVIVTGANKGIGYTIIETLLQGTNTYNIILAARNASLGSKAAEDLQAKYTNSPSKVVFHQLDVDDEKSANDFAEWFKVEYGKIDALINNAGLSSEGRNTGEEKAQVVKTNVLSLVNLTEKLIPLLSNEGKVINISSPLAIINLHKPEIRELLNDDQISEKTFNYLINKFYDFTKELKHTELGFSKDPYFASKALVNVYTRFILPRKLKGDQQAFAACPGWCRTEMGGPDANRTVEEGAATPVFLVDLPWKKDESLHAKYIRDNHAIDPIIDTYPLSGVFAQ